jgi:hypothetical protein
MNNYDEMLSRAVDLLPEGFTKPTVFVKSVDYFTYNMICDGHSISFLVFLNRNEYNLLIVAPLNETGYIIRFCNLCDIPFVSKEVKAVELDNLEDDFAGIVKTAIGGTETFLEFWLYDPFDGFPIDTLEALRIPRDHWSWDIAVQRKD